MIEAVFENMEIKKEVFAKLDKICKPGATLCSNTSSLSIDEVLYLFILIIIWEFQKYFVKYSALFCWLENYNFQIASATSRPQDVIGTHFFAPAYYMPLLENVRGEKTSPETIATATNFGLKIKKVQ